MGIPRLFGWLQGCCPDAFCGLPEFKARARQRRERQNERRQGTGDSGQSPYSRSTSEFDNLYMDLNGYIHAAVASILSSSPAGGASLDADVVANTAFEIVDGIVRSAIKPNKRIFLAIDGMAPVAKIMQQRQRRYSRSCSSSMETVGERAFDLNSLSAGTSFMEAVSSAIGALVQQKVQSGTSGPWTATEVTFSGNASFIHIIFWCIIFIICII